MWTVHDNILLNYTCYSRPLAHQTNIYELDVWPNLHFVVALPVITRNNCYTANLVFKIGMQVVKARIKASENVFWDEMPCSLVEIAGHFRRNKTVTRPQKRMI